MATTTTKGIDPRVKRTRKLLQQAFLDLFQQKSFTSISIQDITERATVNRATFYAHFTDKYTLLDSIIREQFQDAVADKLAPDANWSVYNLRLLIKAIFDYLDGFYSHCRPVDRQFEPLIESALQQELATILLNWLKKAPIQGNKARIRLETTASMMSWAIFGPAIEWSRNGSVLSSEEMTEQVLLFLTEGGTHF